MSATFGNTSTPNSGWVAYGVNTPPYQVAQAFNGFPGGTISDIYCYFAGWTAAVNAKVCLWDGNGTLLYSNPGFGVGQGGSGIGQQMWIHATSVNYNMYAGDLYIGWWRDPAGTVSWTYSAGGTFVTSSASTPGSLTIGYGTNSGSIGAYVVYTTGGIKVQNSSSSGDVTKHPTKVYMSGGSWQWSPLKSWNGSSWLRRG